MERRRDSTDSPGKTLGLVVFILGVGLLLFVFYRGYVEFTQVGQLPQALSGNTRDETTLVLVTLARWALLFILAYVASAVAGRGIGLYQAARGILADEG